MADHERRLSLPESLPPLPEYPADAPSAAASGAQDAVRRRSPDARGEVHWRASARSGQQQQQQQAEEPTYDLPDTYANLNELAGAPPLQDHEREQLHAYRVRSLEDAAGRPAQTFEIAEEEPPRESSGSRFATQLYTHSYLILFAMLGTWARLGITRLTRYPGAPLSFPSVWANFAGSVIMGFLTEDQMLFRQGYGPRANSEDATNAVNAGENDRDRDGGRSEASPTPRKTRQEIKKTTPLYIGLATGFCGSFTSFSSMIRDAFLAISNDIPSMDIGYPPEKRQGGYSFMAFLAVVITSISLSLGGLFLGSHLATELERLTPTLPYKFTRKFLDRIMVVVGLGGWILILFLSLFPPNTAWRGTPLLDLVFSPLGCLARFYLSILLNGRVSGFPLGTFAANVLGTTLLGMFWDLTHLHSGLAGCQVLTSLQDGFCGPLTTVSTWVLELSTLKRAHAYIYGAVSVVVSLVMLIVIMGSLRWTQGFTLPIC